MKDRLILNFKDHIGEGALLGVMGNWEKNLVNFLGMAIGVFIAIADPMARAVMHQTGSILTLSVSNQLGVPIFHKNRLNENLAYSETHSLECTHEAQKRQKKQTQKIQQK